MSYHQTYRAVSNPVNSYNPSPSSMSRKPANYASSLRSVSPMPPTSSPNQQSVHNQTTAHLHSPTPQTPLHSFPTAGQSPVTPSITPDISRSQAATPQTQDRPLYATSPISPAISRSYEPPRPQPSPAPSNINTNIVLRPLTPQETDDALRTCLRIQSQAVNEHGKRPFAAVILAPDNISVLASHNSISHYQHAESELARLAAAQFSARYLESCTLVSTWEPCAMCSGTIYWTGIGRVLYAANESRLKELTGPNNAENLTLDLPCRMILQAGQRPIEVIGPVPSWEAKVVEESGKWWAAHQAGGSLNGNANGLDVSRSRSSSVKENGSVHSKRNSVTIYNPNESLLGSIGEDGEYQADLKIDWMP